MRFAGVCHRIERHRSSLSEFLYARKLTRVTLSVGLVAEAREVGVIVSKAAEVGVAAAVACRPRERWLGESQVALESSNEFVEQYGLPLAQHLNL